MEIEKSPTLSSISISSLQLGCAKVRSVLNTVSVAFEGLRAPEKT